MRFKVEVPHKTSIEFSYDESQVPPEDVNWFQEQLQNQLCQGKSLAANETIEIGWGLFQLAWAGPNELSLREPDFLKFPIKWVEGVTKTLRHLRNQNDIVSSLHDSVEPHFPSIRQFAMVCRHLGTTATVWMERDEPREDFSGWYITCDDDNDVDGHISGNLNPESLYSVALKCPHVVKFMALPPGYAGCFGVGELELVSQDGPVVVRSGSYLEKLKSSRARNQ